MKRFILSGIIFYIIINFSLNAENSFEKKIYQNKKIKYAITGLSKDKKTSICCIASIQKANNSEVAIPGILPATDISDNGFTANWNASTGSEKYGLYTYLTYKAPNANNYTLAYEDFSTITGDEDEGLYVYLDKYTNRPDWTVWLPVYGEGHIGIDNRYKEYLGSGSLESPVYDLRNTSGQFNVKITARSNTKDQLYLYNHIIKDNGKESSTQYSKTFTENLETFNFLVSMDMNSYKSNYIEIQSSNNTSTQIHDIEITIGLQENNAVRLPYHYTETTSTSEYINTTDKTDGDTYSYAVASVYYDATEDKLKFTDYSNFIEVRDDISSINDTEFQCGIIVKDCAHIYLQTPSMIEIYNISGKLISSTSGNAGENIVYLPTKGIYIVKTNDYTTKIIK